MKQLKTKTALVAAFLSISAHHMMGADSGQAEQPSPGVPSTPIDWPVPAGWPVQIPELIAPELIQPVVLDLDNDGAMEVVVLTLHDLRILTPGGNPHPGAWPFKFPVDFGTGNLSLAVINMDDDPDLEILFSRNQPSLVDPQEVDVHVFNLDGSYADGWPRTVDGLAQRVIVADLDADGSNEVLIATHRPARIHVLRADGTPFGDAWPRDFVFLIRSIATADLDGDGDLEIIAYDAILGSSVPIHAMHHDGTDVDGWPAWVPEAPNSQLVVGDVDRDGIPEIAFAVLDSFESRVYLLNAKGQPFNIAWPVVLPPSGSPWSVALGDVDADGYLDILVSGQMRQVFAIDRFGTILPGWPALIPFPFPTIPYQNIIHAVADVDGDGMPEVVVGALIGPCIFNHDGTPLPGAVPLPVELPHTSARLPLTVAVADVDLDGDVEIFSGIWRTLYAWDFPGPECSVQWPRSSGNLGNTGAVTPPTVDTSEWALFNTCLTGPDAGAIPPECICLDADNDADIDVHDFAALQRAFGVRVPHR